MGFSFPGGVFFFFSGIFHIPHCLLCLCYFGSQKVVFNNEEGTSINIDLKGDPPSQLIDIWLLPQVEATCHGSSPDARIHTRQGLEKHPTPNCLLL